MASTGVELRIRLLGGFEVQVGTRTVDDADWRLRKTRSLVKLLALAPGHQLHREQLMDTLWPDQDADAAANNLHKAVYIARRALEPDLSPATPSRYIRLLGDTLVLHPPGRVWIDAEVFREQAAAARSLADPLAYQAALTLYTGELFPDDRYEDWAAGHREELQAMRIRLLLELAWLEESRGALPAAIDALRAVVATDPAHEEAHGTLMRLYAQSGQRHQALHQYEKLRDSLRRELDVEPEPTSQQLHQDIVSGRLASPPATVSGPVPATPELARRASPLVGRGAELEMIDDVLDGVFAARRGRLLLVAGEAGIGKSSLAATVAERTARRGGVVLVGAAYELEGRLPYGPFVEALGPLAPSELQGVLGAAATDLARLPSPAVSALRADRQRLFMSVAEALRRRAGSAPVLLVLEDLHAADESSLQLLHYVARTTANAPVLLLATYRAEEAPPVSQLGRLVAALGRERLAVRLELNPLTPAECDLLVLSLLEGGPADREVLDAIREVAAGNPLYTREVVLNLQETGQLHCVDGRWRLRADELPLPRAVLDLLGARIDRLGRTAVQVLTTAAVIGRDVDYRLLRVASGLPDAAVLDAVDACLESGTLRETAEGYRFGHPLQRAAAYDRLSRARRATLHGRVAAALEELHSVADAQQHAETLAHHWALSDSPGRAISHLIAAGDRAVSVCAHQAAVDAYTRALKLLAQPGLALEIGVVVAEVWEKLADVWALIADATREQEAYRAAIDALGPAPSPLHLDRRARLYRKAAYEALVRHDVDSTSRYLAEAEQVVAIGSVESGELARVRLVRALWLWELGRLDEGRAAAEESVRLARQRGEGFDLINAYMTLGLVFHSSGEWKAGLEIETEQIGPAADQDPRLGLLFDAHACLGEYHLYGDVSFEAAEAYARRMLELATRVGARRAQALGALLVGAALLLRGRWDEAASYLSTSVALQREVGSAAGQALALQRLAELAVYRGAYEIASDHLAEASRLPIGAAMAPHVLGRLRATSALNALERGDAPAAGRILHEAAELAGRTGECATCNALIHPVATRTYVALGQLARAEAHVAAASNVAAHWGSGAWQAHADAARAQILLARDDASAAYRYLRSAADTFERIGQRFDAARCLLQLGVANNTPDLVQTSLQISSELGAAGLEARARQAVTRL